MKKCSNASPSLWSLCVQIGSYYGSEVCGLDIDQDGITDVLLVAAPMFLGSGNKEDGRVYIYTFNGVRRRPAQGQKGILYGADCFHYHENKTIENG